MAGWYDLGYSLKGADGVGVASAAVDAGGNLTLTLTNNTTLGPFAVKGSKGDTGTAGTAGTNGQPGRGIAQVSFDGSTFALSLQLTDGTTAGPFQVRGAPGADGRSITFTGTVATYAALPTNLGANDAGKGYYVEADGQLYPWSGTAFPAQNSGIAVRGPKGDQGIQGIQGARGTKITALVTPPATGLIIGDLNINPSTGRISQYLESAP